MPKVKLNKNKINDHIKNGLSELVTNGKLIQYMKAVNSNWNTDIQISLQILELELRNCYITRDFYIENNEITDIEGTISGNSKKIKQLEKSIDEIKKDYPEFCI